MSWRILFAAQLAFALPAFATVDQSLKLEDVLEHGTLSKKDCDDYRAGKTDRETTLRCGKWTYFYDPLGVAGLPLKLVDLLRKNAPINAGESLEGFGLYPDPYSKEKLPVGFVPGVDLVPGLTTYVPTCGTCHLGKLPNGEYKVGQPNYDFNVSKLSLVLSSLAEYALNSKTNPGPIVTQVTDPVIKEFYGENISNFWLKLQVLTSFPLSAASIAKPPTQEMKVILAQTPAGIFDPYVPPLVDDGISQPQRYLPLWGLNPAGMQQAGSVHGGMITSSGGVKTLLDSLLDARRTAEQMSKKSLKESQPESYYTPLVEYIMSLQAPHQAGPFDSARVASGKSLFTENCASCHNAPDYAGTKIFDPDEIGVDPMIRYTLDPTLSGNSLYGILQPSEVTHGVRAGRLVGIWSLSRFLHNGAVNSLEELFCLNGPRPEPIPVVGLSNAGHMYTCDGLAREEKEDLIYFLHSL